MMETMMLACALLIANQLVESFVVKLMLLMSCIIAIQLSAVALGAWLIYRTAEMSDGRMQEKREELRKSWEVEDE